MPLEKLGDPIDKASVTRSLNNWIVDPRRNLMAEGLLKVEVAGEYRFLSSSYYGRNAFYVNGSPVCQYGAGETISRVNLKPGLVPIASIGYALGRDTVDVQWAPPGQPELSEIPVDRLFYSADLQAKRTAQIEAAAEKRRSQAAAAVVAIDTTSVEPGLLVTEYPRHSKQLSKNSAFVPRKELGKPISKPSVIDSLDNWIVNPTYNSVAEGLLKIEVAGEYRFLSSGYYGRNAFYVNGSPVCQYGAGETISRVNLKPGLVPIASIGYALGRDTVDVQWAPPGQPELSEIPVDRLFYSADLQAKLAAETE